MGINKKKMFGKKSVSVVLPTMTLSTTSTDAAWTPNFVNNDGPLLFWTVTGDIEIGEVEDNTPEFDLTLNIGSADMTVYDVSQVITFRVLSKLITSIDVTDMVALTELQVQTNQLTALDLSGCPDLEMLYCQSNAITSLDFSNNPDIYYINVGQNPLETINFENNSALLTFLAGSALLESIDLSDSIIQIYINISGANLSSLTLGSILFEQMFVLNSDLPDGFSVAGMTDLHRIYCYGNNYTVTATNQLLADLVANGRSVGNERLRYRNNETGQGVTDRATLVTRGWTIMNFAT